MKAIQTINSLRFSMVLALCIASSHVYAQFELSGEYRPRFEFRHGYKQLSPKDADAAMFISQRTRLNGDYKSENSRFFLSMQDVRTWGDLPQLSTENAKLTLHQAWAEIPLYSSILSLKAGRQEIIYDDSRLFGNVDWAQQGRSHDAAIFRFKKFSTKIDLGLAYNQFGEPLFGNIYSVQGNYKVLNYIWLHQEFGKIGLSLIAVNNGMQYQNPSDSSFSTVFSQTAGGRLTTSLKDFGIALAGYFQTGKNAKNKDLSAYFFAFNIDYPLTQVLRVNAGIEYLSGNSQTQVGTKDKAFNPLYGTGHKFNGHMDYFYVGNHSGSVGLQDLYFELTAKKGEIASYLSTHFFSSAGNVADPANPGSALSKSLGTEIDFNVSYKLGESVQGIVGYSQMLPTESLVALRGGQKDEMHNWFWVMLVYKPVFLK